MGPKDPTQISLAVIQAVLKPGMTSEHLPDMGFTLKHFLDKGIDNLEKLTQRSTRFKLYEAVDTYLRKREEQHEQATALDVLYYLRDAITFALLSPIGSLWGVETVEPHSTNPFKATVGGLVNEELRRIYQELYLDCLPTLEEVLLHDIMDDPKNSIRADQRQHFETIKTEAANARS